MSDMAPRIRAKNAEAPALAAEISAGHRRPGFGGMHRWVSLEQALQDPAYALPIGSYTGAGGISWLHRWAITKGMDATVFRGEPVVPGWVENRTAARGR